MRPFSSPPVARRVRSAVAALLLVASSAAALAQAPDPARSSGSQSAEDEPLILEVFVNGTATGKVGEFTRRNGRLYARAAELRDLGLAVPGDAEVALADLPGIAARLDETALRLFIDAAVERLETHDLQARPDGSSGTPDRGGTGLLLNYDAVAMEGPGGLSGTALLEARGFSDAVSIDSRFLAGAAGVVRLESGLAYADPAHLRRYVLGDLIGGGLAWTRPVRMAGLQVSTAFEMRPDLVTFPLPTVRGTIALPSSVDLVVDGIRQMSSDVAPGPFSISRIAVPAGAGTIAVETRDALGRVTETDVHTYASPDLLAPGLTSFSLEAGAIRRSFGLASNDYGPLAASATYRHGFRGLTLESHAEARSGLLEGGVGSDFIVGDLAAASIAVAASEHRGRAGFLLRAGVERQTRAYHLSLVAETASRNYSDLASAGGDPVIRFMLQASAGAFLGRWGSFDLSYIRLRSDGATGGLLPFGGGTPPALLGSYRLSAMTASYTRPIGTRVQLSVAGFRDFGSHASAVTLTLSFALSGRRQASAAASLSNGEAAGAFDVRQNATRTGQLGWDVQASAGVAPHGFAEVQYRSPYGTFGGGLDLSRGSAVGQLSASGSVAFMDNSFFVANPVRDSFAIVDAGGQRGLEVMEDNQPAGRTNGAGKLILTDVRGFDSNRIAFAANDLPLDASFAADEMVVRPLGHSGIVANLGIKRGNALLVDLVDADAKPIAVGSQAFLNGGSDANPVGYGGQIFFTDVAEHNRLLVETPEGTRCEARFDRPQRGDGIVEIGPIACRPAADRTD